MRVVWVWGRVKRGSAAHVVGIRVARPAVLKGPHLEVSFGFGIRSESRQFRGSLWTSYQPLEPQDAAVHFRQAQSDPHH